MKMSLSNVFLSSSDQKHGFRSGYVKAFSSLIFDIKNMSEEDKLQYCNRALGCKGAFEKVEAHYVKAFSFVDV